MPTHASPAKYSKAVAQQIYESLGELTENELLDLLHNHSSNTRNTYLRNVYGNAAGTHARRVYTKWRAEHLETDCSECVR